MIKRLMIVINVLKYIFELKYNIYKKTNSTLKAQRHFLIFSYFTIFQIISSLDDMICRNFTPTNGF